MGKGVRFAICQQPAPDAGGLCMRRYGKQAQVYKAFLLFKAHKTKEGGIGAAAFETIGPRPVQQGFHLLFRGALPVHEMPFRGPARAARHALVSMVDQLADESGIPVPSIYCRLCLPVNNLARKMVAASYKK